MPLLIRHHVIPHRFKSTYPGDIHDTSLAAVLCGTCAVVADAISGTNDNVKNKDFSTYRGPRTKAELLDNLKRYHEGPDAWAAEYWPKFDQC